MLHRARLIALCALLVLQSVSADILWDTCLGEADHPTIVEGNYFNLCIRDHVFTDENHAWTFTKTNIGTTIFDSCSFENTKDKTSNYTEAVWSDVEFRSCRFGSLTDVPMIFDQTTMNNVTFKDCTFHSSVDVVFSKFLLNQVKFENCKFESNLFFELGEANELSFSGSTFKRSEHATTPSGTDSITFRLVTIHGLTFIDSDFVTPLRFEGVSAADLDFNDTTLNEFHCHSPPLEPVAKGSDPKIKYKSQFNDTAFQTVNFNGDITCDRTLWRGLFMNEVVMYKNADFSYNNVLDLDWDEIDLKSEDGTCYELDFSNSEIKRKCLANVTASCKVNFEQTTFETVLVKNFFAKKPNFEDATFSQEYVDGHCCTRACVPLRCKCNVTLPSDECPVGTRDVNIRLPDTCFPADATLTRHDGSVISMEDLAIAERIAVGGGEYSDVFFFGHRSRDSKAEFVSIRHAMAARPLRMSAGHYLYVNGGLRTAGLVKPGDRLRGADGEDNLLVTEVTTVTGRGLYAPTSIHGDLLVEGVVVSSYTNALHPGVAHKLLHPLRLLYRYGFDSVVSRMTFLHERSLSGLSQAIGIPRGPDIVRD